MPVVVLTHDDGVNLGKLIAIRANYTGFSTSGAEPTGFSSEPGQTDYVYWTRFTHDAINGLLKFTDRYHDIPSSGTGTLSTNFYRTVTKYDLLGRPEYLVDIIRGSSASDRVEQVTRNVYDIRDRIIEVKRGVSGDAAANSHNMTDDYNAYPTLRTIKKIEYDADGVGDSHVTKTKKYFGVGTNDFTGASRKLTYRGHLRGIEPFYMNGSAETATGPYTVVDVDWQGKTVSKARYDTAPTWSTVLTGDSYLAYASSTSTNRRSREDMIFDDLGRIYQSRHYKIAVGSGTGSEYLSTNHCYDRNNRLVAAGQEHAAATETAYDGAARVYQTRRVLSLESTKYSSGKFQYRDPVPHPTRSSMSGGDDLILELTHQVFDASGNVTEIHNFENNHDDASSGTAGIDVTANDDYVRRSIYRWFDAADRLAASADYGSGDTTAGAGIWKYVSAPSRPGSAPTASDDSRLVTLYAYSGDSGRSEVVTDPSGSKTKTFYDDLGRRTHVAENWDNFAAVGETGAGDSIDKSKDCVRKYVYHGPDRVRYMVAMDSNGDGTLSDNQMTTYLYEDPVDSGFRTNEIYPDSSDATSSGSDQVKFVYNVDASVATRTDQRGTVMTYTFSNRRQPEMDQVTTLGGNTDGHIRAFKRSYDSMARLERMTSTANPDGTGTVRNEIQYAYNDFSEPIAVYQSHEDAVNTMSTPKVQYTYDTMASGSVFSRNHRLESVIYPSGRTIFFDYDTGNADYPSNRLSRARNIRNTNVSGTIFAQYHYNGMKRLAIADLQEPDIKLDYFQGTSGTYAGLDRFGRVKDQFWDGYNSTVDVDRLKYAHDYAGSRIYRDIDSSVYGTNDKDQAWTYDGLHRLKTHDEGTLSGTTITSTPAKEQDWSLDLLGNWSNFVTKTAGTTDLNQTRATNAVNEISGITESTGTAWIDPAYDAAGNMTTIPKPPDLTTGYVATYDAWNRLVKLQDGMSTVAEYEYDGTMQRIIKSVYASGSLDHREHSYFNKEWQVLEVRKEVNGTEDTDPLEQYVWHPYYIDALIFREVDSDTDGSSDRYYSIHDANYNVTAITNSSGLVIERYNYSPYGELTVLDANFAVDSDGISDIANVVTYTGRQFDMESQLMQFRNRYLQAQVGGFISRDPVDFKSGDFNLYRYVGGRPVDFTDPSGKDCPGCTVPPLLSFLNENSCTRQCCSMHDKCYFTHRCTSDSWRCRRSWPAPLRGGGLPGSPENCPDCNYQAYGCMISCAIFNDPIDIETSSAPEYYCARQGRYIRIPGDFPDPDAANAACCTSDPDPDNTYTCHCENCARRGDNHTTTVTGRFPRDAREACARWCGQFEGDGGCDTCDVRIE